MVTSRGADAAPYAARTSPRAAARRRRPVSLIATRTVCEVRPGAMEGSGRTTPAQGASTYPLIGAVVTRAERRNVISGAVLGVVMAKVVGVVAIACGIGVETLRGATVRTLGVASMRGEAPSAVVAPVPIAALARARTVAVASCTPERSATTTVT